MEQRTRKIYRVTCVGLVVNVLLAVGKLIAGVVGHSGAMIADALHSISDMASDFVVLAFVRIANKPADANHPKGHAHYDNIAAIIVSVILIIVAGGILWEAIENICRIASGEIIPRPGAIALAAAVVSIVVKEWLYRYTVRIGKQVDSPSVIANAWHHRSDALSSIGTLIGIGLAFFLGEKWRIADPIAAVFVAALIFKIAVSLIRDGIKKLMGHASCTTHPTETHTHHGRITTPK